jgi:hypothetical protein
MVDSGDNGSVTADWPAVCSMVACGDDGSVTNPLTGLLCAAWLVVTIGFCNHSTDWSTVCSMIGGADNVSITTQLTGRLCAAWLVVVTMVL